MHDVDVVFTEEKRAGSSTELGVTKAVYAAAEGESRLSVTSDEVEAAVQWLLD